MDNVMIGKDRISEDIFKISVVESRTKRIVNLRSIGLYSDTRDSLHQREIQIIQEMILNKIIEVESYYLCENSYNGVLNEARYNRYSRYNRYYSSRDEIEIKDLYLFADYRQEPEHMKIAKYIAYNYLKESYNIEWDRDSNTMYIEELNLLIANENQKISDFIYRALNKDINFAVITQYNDSDETRECNKIAIRYIKPRRDLLEEVYGYNTLSYSWYVNNFNDVLERYMSVKGYINNILIKRNKNIEIEENLNEKRNCIKSCAICVNLKRYCSDSPYRHLITNNPDNFLDLATERDLCTLGSQAFDIQSNDIKCENYKEVTVKCTQCNNDIKYTDFYLNDKKFCSDECKKEYDEIQAKQEERRKIWEEERRQKALERKERLNKKYREIEEIAEKQSLSEEEVKKMKKKAKIEEIFGRFNSSNILNKNY